MPGKKKNTLPDKNEEVQQTHPLPDWDEDQTDDNTGNDPDIIIDEDLPETPGYEKPEPGEGP